MICQAHCTQFAFMLCRQYWCISYIKLQYDRCGFSKKKRKVWVVHLDHLTLEISRCCHSSSSLAFSSSDSCESVARIPTELLSNCWQKWSTESLNSRTKQAKLSASAFDWINEKRDKFYIIILIQDIQEELLLKSVPRKLCKLSIRKLKGNWYIERHLTAFC